MSDGATDEPLLLSYSRWRTARTDLARDTHQYSVDLALRAGVVR